MGDGYYIYLRKSRQDRDLEASTGKHDTLERHRAALLELASKRGLTVTGIYEEVVSGDTIAERPEMQRLLADVEKNKCAGVLVMEVARLARGNTTDQGIVAEALLSGERIQVFDVIEDSEAAARKTLGEYLAYLGKPNDKGSGEGGFVSAVDPLFGQVLIGRRGKHLIGAIRMKEAEAARPLVEALQKRLIDVSGP